MKTQYGFYFEEQKCIKCYACEIACEQWHSIDAGTFKLRWVIEEEKGTFPKVSRTFLAVACRHCADARCITSCKVNAISRSDEGGIVTVDSSKCNGCRDCFEACSFSIPQFNKAGILQICDMCSGRLAQGKQPICSDSCPTQALQWKANNEH